MAKPTKLEPRTLTEEQENFCGTVMWRVHKLVLRDVTYLEDLDALIRELEQQERKPGRVYQFPVGGRPKAGG